MANGNNPRQNRDPYATNSSGNSSVFDSYFADDHFVDDFFEETKPQQRRKQQPKQDPNWYLSPELSDSRSEALNRKRNPQPRMHNTTANGQSNRGYMNSRPQNQPRNGAPMSRTARRHQQSQPQYRQSAPRSQRPSSQRPNPQRTSSNQAHYNQALANGRANPNGRRNPNPNPQRRNGGYPDAARIAQNHAQPNYGGPNRPNNPKGNHKKSFHRPGIIAYIISAAAVLALLWLLFQLVRINILPMMLLMIVCGLVVLIGCLLIGFWLFKSKRAISRYILGALVVVYGVGCAFGGFMLKDTDQMFEQVTNLTDKQVNSVTVYAMKESNIEKPGDLTADKRLGVAPTVDQTGYLGIVDQLHDEGASFTEVSFDNVFDLVDALYANEVDVIAFPEIQHDALYEIADDDNKYNALTTFTNYVDSFLYYTDRNPTSINKADPVLNIMSDPFVVLVSGNDSYGSISQDSRSDVNMLVVVNPKTAQVLMVSIPRDAYMPISCNKNQFACADVAGYEDKLTHTGLYGIGTTESTIEDYFGLKINYYIRVNFSSLINIVDAIGGIDVEVEPGLEVETFYANGTEGVHAGMNHLDGERALAFSRERHAYLDGDLQRTKNQQIVLRAMLKALLSPAMVVNYPDVMKALSTAFDTNMSANEIKSLLTLELSHFPKWNIQSFAILGDPSTQFSASAMQELSVMILYDDYVEEAKTLINQVLNGQTINLEAPVTDYTNIPTTDDGTGEEENQITEGYVEEPVYEDPNAGVENPDYSEDDEDPGYYEEYPDYGYEDPGYETGGEEYYE
ncbi:MAG: LCP family protein [Allobaculum sp.]